LGTSSYFCKLSFVQLLSVILVLVPLSVFPASTLELIVPCERLLLETDQSSSRVVILAEGVSSGSFLPARLTKRGYKVYHLRPTHDIPPFLAKSFHPKDYVGEIIHDGNIQETLQRIRELRPLAIIAGSERGVFLTDTISEDLGLPSNGTQFSIAKRDKYLMHQVLKKAGLEHIRQIKSDDLQEIYRWIQTENAGRYPVVVKPVASAGTEGFAICQNEMDIRRAFSDIMANFNMFGETNPAVLVQEFIQGPEFAVNTVSSQGRHVITDLWAYNKQATLRDNGTTSMIYDYDQLVDVWGEKPNQLRRYATQVLDAFGIKYGPVHMEIMITPDRGPVMIELGARFGGSGMPMLAEKAMSIGPLDLCIDAFLDPQHFKTIWENQDQLVRLVKHVRSVELISPRTGRLVGISDAVPVNSHMSIPQLFSENHLGLTYPIGEVIPRTVDLLTAPGHLVLINDDLSVLEADYAVFRRIERNGFYQFADDSSPQE
jgi:hypothetical protein